MLTTQNELLYLSATIERRVTLQIQSAHGFLTSITCLQHPVRYLLFLLELLSRHALQVLEGSTADSNLSDRLWLQMYCLWRIIRSCWRRFAAEGIGSVLARRPVNSLTQGFIGAVAERHHLRQNLDDL